MFIFAVQVERILVDCHDIVAVVDFVDLELAYAAQQNDAALEVPVLCEPMWKKIIQFLKRGKNVLVFLFFCFFVYFHLREWNG